MNYRNYQTLSAGQADSLIRAGGNVVVVDVREQNDRRLGAIPGSLSIPGSQLQALAPRMIPDKSAKVLVYCQTGAHSWLSASRLCEMGYTQVYDMGSFLGWRQNHR